MFLFCSKTNEVGLLPHSTSPSSSSATLSRVGLWGRSFSRDTQPFPGQVHLLRVNRWVPQMFPGQLRNTVPPAMPWVFLGASFRWDMPGTPTSPRRRPESIKNRCPSHLKCAQCGGAAALTQSSSWVTKLFTLRSITPLRKLVPAACVHNLVLSVITQSR